MNAPDEGPVGAPQVEAPPVLVAGTGAVGGAAARYLGLVGVGRILCSDRRARRARVAARAVGSPGLPAGHPVAEVVPWRPGRDLPGGPAVVACAMPPGPEVRAVRAAIQAGIGVVTATDDAATIADLLELGPSARAAGVTVVVGAGLAPGLADVFAGHAAEAFDVVEEIHVARCGVAGRACARVAERARGRRAFEWRGGVRTEVRRRGPELVWFPDPVGARDCVPTTDGIRLLARAFPDVALLSARRSRPGGRRLGRRETGPAAVRVRVWGQRGRAREVLEYGAVGEAAELAGAMLAVVAGALARRDERVLDLRPGVMGAAEVVRPRAVLAQLAELGTQLVAFEGVPVR